MGYRRHCAALAAGLVLLGSACGPAQQTPAQQGAGTGAAPGSPRQGGVFRGWEKTDFTADMDPTTTNKGGAGLVGNLSYNSLLGFKVGPDVKYDELILEPELAEKWEVSPDAKAYTFHLRKGVRFQDLPPVNGREMTSADVKWSLEYFGRVGQFKQDKNLRKNQFAFQVEGLDSIDTPDPYTVTVRFKDGYVPFLNYAATREMPVFAHEVYEQDGDLHQTVVGTGPWMYDPKESQAGSKMVWKRNPGYFESGKPYIDEFEALVIPDEGSAYAAFETRQLDQLLDIPDQQAQQVHSALADAPMLQYFQSAPGRLYTNVSRPPLDDARLRKAINLAMDRSEYIKTFTNTQGLLGIPGTFKDTFTQEELQKMLPYQPDAARTLLQEAGYDGREIDLLYPGTEYGQMVVNWVQLFQAQMKRVGINVTLRSQERVEMSRNRRAGEYMLSPSPTTSLQPDVDGALAAMYLPDSAANYGRIDDPDLTALIHAERSEVDPKKRADLIRKAGELINERSYNYAFYFAPVYAFWQARVKGYSPNISNKGRITPDVWLAD